MANLSEKQGLLLLSISAYPEASKEIHRKNVGASKQSNNFYKLQEHGYVIKNPVSGVAKHGGNYFEFQPERKEAFAEDSETSEQIQEILDSIEELGGKADSVAELSEEVSIDYQNLLELLNKLQQEDGIEFTRSGNKKGVKLLDRNVSLDEPDYDIYMITGRGVSALKEFIESQPPIIRRSLKELYENRIVYAPAHTVEKVEN